jgi:competence protein ComEC
VKDKVGARVDWVGLLQGQRGQLFPWVPVCMGLGIGAYFALPAEPGLGLTGALVLAAAGALGLRLRAAEAWHVPALALGLVAAGLLLAALRAHMVAGPVLPFRYYGPVEGRIVEIDRSFSDAIRITLDHVRLADVDPAVTPRRVRVALHGRDGDPLPGTLPQPGLTVMLTGHLAAPEGPVAPGGFDFQRIAWFDSLGAVGYTRAPVMALAPAKAGSVGLAAFEARMAISRAMQAQMPGQDGALAAAFMTGDRSGVNAQTNEVMRASNLSHMISISGLHMGLLVGFVFGLVRYGLVLVPPVALRIDTRKVAAGIALVAATAYMLLAGPDVATRRAWIMAAVMLVAVMLDRRAISMRTLAVAAVIVLLLEPESLLNPGFQMSFGATAALIAIMAPWQAVQGRVPAVLRPVALLVLTSLVAGLATGPIAAVHFNRIAPYGLVANLLAVPLMGVIVMPAGVVAAILAPLGLAAPALWLMEAGTRAILVIAEWVAGFGGATAAVPTPPAWVLPVFALGGAVFLLARAPVRQAGSIAVALALAGWTAAPRPEVLVAGDGALVGVMTEGGRALSRAKGAGFVAKNWLEDDGDLSDQVTAHARGLFAATKGRAEAAWGGRAIVQLTGRTAPDRAAAECRDGVILVMDRDWPAAQDDAAGAATGPGGCMVLDPARLAATGALALTQDAKGALVIHAARATAGQRLWNAAPPPRRPRGQDAGPDGDAQVAAVVSRSGSARPDAPAP